MVGRTRGANRLLACSACGKRRIVRPLNSIVRPTQRQRLRYAYNMHIMGVCPSSTTHAKAAANLKKHGVSFADAEGVLSDPLSVTIKDTAPLVKRVS